jgi:sterol 24-C-methyltransferase
MAPVATENNVVTDDGRQKNRMEAYTKFWQNDMSKEKDIDTSNRLTSYTDVVNGTYCSPM